MDMALKRLALWLIPGDVAVGGVLVLTVVGILDVIIGRVPLWVFIVLLVAWLVTQAATVLVRWVVLAHVQDLNYEVCPECEHRLHPGEGRFLCTECGGRFEKEYLEHHWKHRTRIAPDENGLS